DIGGTEPRDRRGEPGAAAFAESPSLGEEPRHAPAKPGQAGKLDAGECGAHALAHHDPAGPDEPERRAHVAHDAMPMKMPAETTVKAPSPNEVPRCRRNSCAR